MNERVGHAFLFEGHGQQQPGMFHDLYDQSSVARAFFNRADVLAAKKLSYRVTDVCFGSRTTLLEGSTMSFTAVSLALLTGGVATVHHLQAEGVPPPTTSLGHSLGQWIAAEKFLGFDADFELMIRRGQIMDGSKKIRESAVAVIADLKGHQYLLQQLVDGKLKELGISVEGVKNTVINSTHNLVYGGPRYQIEILLEAIKQSHPELYAKILKKVPFSHHPDLAEEQAEFNNDLDKVQERHGTRGRTPIVDDLGQGLLEHAGRFIEAKKRHFLDTVVWSANLHRLEAMGLSAGVEIGPGNIFSKMGDLECPSLTIYPTNNMEAIKKVIELLAI